MDIKTFLSLILPPPDNTMRNKKLPSLHYVLIPIEHFTFQNEMGECWSKNESPWGMHRHWCDIKYQSVRLSFIFYCIWRKYFILSYFENIVWETISKHLHHVKIKPFHYDRKFFTLTTIEQYSSKDLDFQTHQTIVNYLM